MTPSPLTGTDGPSAQTGAAPGGVRGAGTVAGSAGTPTSGEGVRFICDGCGQERSGSRIPPGWKRDGELAVCGKCWRRDYELRAVSVPIAVESATPEFWRLMRTGWKVARRVANYYARQLYLTDDWGAVDDQKLPRYPHSPELCKRLYDFVRAYAPEYTTVSSNALMNWLRQTYLRRRFDLWIGQVSLPTYRSVPWMVRKTGWTAAQDGSAVTITCHGVRPTLKLDERECFSGQRALLARASQGDLLRGDAKLCEHGKRIMFRAAVWVPVQQRSGRVGTLCVRTSDRALLVFDVAGSSRRALRPLHLRHVMAWVRKHDDWRQSAADDTKYEKRWPSHVRRDMLEALEQRCRKANDRIATACQQVAAMVVGYADRQDLAEIRLDLEPRGYAPRFPYGRLAGNIQSAAELRGIGCARAQDAM